MATVTYHGTSVCAVAHIVSRNTDLARRVWQRSLPSGPVYCVHRGRSAPLVVGGYGGDRRPQRVQALGMAIGGALRAMLNMDFRELRLAELPRARYTRSTQRVARTRPREPLTRGLVDEPAHGRQAGKASSAGASVSLVRPEPSAFIT